MYRLTLSLSSPTPSLYVIYFIFLFFFFNMNYYILFDLEDCFYSVSGFFFHSIASSTDDFLQDCIAKTKNKQKNKRIHLAKFSRCICSVMYSYYSYALFVILRLMVCSYVIR